MKKDEKIQENNARHAGETHNNNNSLAFGAYGFTCTGMNFLLGDIHECAFSYWKSDTFWDSLETTPLGLSINNI